MARRKGPVVLIILFLVLLVVVVVGQLGRVPEKTVLKLTLSGAVAEEDWPSFNARFWEGEVTVFRDLLEALDRAGRDPRIAGVSLEVFAPEISFGKAQELRAKLAEFTSQGKFCTAYLQFGTNLNYYVATACPEVYLTPTSGLGIHALMAHTTFLRGSLDKLHIVPEYLRIGEYKNAPNVYTEKQFTAEHREVVSSMLTSWQAQLVAGIAEGRKLEPAQVEELIQQGPFLAEEARKKKLVDNLLYPDEYRELLQEKTGVEELRTLTLKEYLGRSSGASGPKIAIVHATGEIVPGESGYHPSLGRYMGAETIAQALREAREDDSVRAIVLRIDSPGGVHFASSIIRRQVQQAREHKPVVASMSDVAASGGYYIAMSANKIVADPGTVTGSIGIYAGKMNLKGFYELLGMSKDHVALSPNATLFYPFESWTPAQREMVMKFLRSGYQEFIEGVAEGRKISVEEANRLGRGRVWLGHQAKENGLVDELGGLERAVAVAKELAAIPAGDRVSYVIYPREKTTWEQIEEWLEVRANPAPALRDALDPTRSPLWREPFLLRMAFDLRPE